MGAEHPGAGGVEGHHPHRPDPAADQQACALTHLPRRLVRERDREDLVGLGGAGRGQVRDPVGQHPGLARARAGENQQRSLAVRDGLSLGLVQALEQRLQIGRDVCHSAISTVAAGEVVAAPHNRSRGAPISGALRVKSGRGSEACRVVHVYGAPRGKAPSLAPDLTRYARPLAGRGAPGSKPLASCRVPATASARSPRLRPRRPADRAGASRSRRRRARGTGRRRPPGRRARSPWSRRPAAPRRWRSR